jgi:hypothetical protein
MEGKNLILESRYADFHQERLQDLVAELLRLKTDVIVALGPPADDRRQIVPLPETPAEGVGGKVAQDGRNPTEAQVAALEKAEGRSGPGASEPRRVTVPAA